MKIKSKNIMFVFVYITHIIYVGEALFSAMKYILLWREATERMSQSDKE
jgi:hypothetical protein